MISKKQLTIGNHLNKTKDVNTKVTVQYIQEQPQLVQKSENSDNHIILNSTQDDLEIENVEYLEENANVEEYADERSVKVDFEDNFYPNAIHCLLDLYKAKYDSFNVGEGGDIKVASLWQDISKNMQESLFEFSARQVQYKYSLLREQYFGVQTKEDIENFDYFEQLHDIYKDAGKEDIVKGFDAPKSDSVYYKDEILLNPIDLGDDIHLNDFKSEEIVHKEHEFIDMVEKELQAMEDDVHVKCSEQILNESPNFASNKLSTDTSNASNLNKTESVKRPLDDIETCTGSPKRRKKFDYFEVSEIVHDTPTGNRDFALFQYNQEQERRHREKMFMLERCLQMQQRALEQQQEILQELIKRLPS